MEACFFVLYSWRIAIQSLIYANHDMISTIQSMICMARGMILIS